MNAAIDSLPLTGSLFTCGDYSGLQVHSLVHQPLAAFLPRRTGESKLEIQIPETLKWSNGETVTAVDYARGLQKAVSPSSAKLLFRGVLRVHAKDQTLTFDLEQPNHRLRDVLSMTKFSPDRDGLSSGAWVKISANHYAPHPYNPIYDEELCLRLVHNPVENMRLFEEGDLDFTADTAFPYANGDQWETTQTSVGLMAAVVFGESLSAREDLRLTIAELCNEISFESVTCGYCPRIPRPLMLAKERVIPSETLRFAYDPFYPNAEIVELIAERLRKNGIKVEVVMDDYYAPKQKFDLRFSILKSLGTSPYLFYLGQLFGFVMRANLDLQRRYAALLRGQQKLVEFRPGPLNLFLAEHAALVPLFEIKSVYRSRRSCANPLLQHLVIT